ncbi:MAG: carboxymuconolactone decarboxylase family protein [Nitrospirae bacterium]|nr:MAG: carboxymuconolactone decarboxylase family protein [Nitrospirota bacterium]
MIQKKKFKKKVYIFPVFLKDFLFFHRNIPAFIASQFHRRISKAFEAKIMLAVTSVNGCKYCAWYHSREALKAGMDQNEVKQLLSSQLTGQIEDRELAALNFAFHYAETDQRPDLELVNNLFEVYGNETASEILVKLRIIYFGNLCGNTFEAFLSRLKGESPENSFWLSELIIFLAVSPLYGLISLMMMRKNEGSW